MHQYQGPIFVINCQYHQIWSVNLLLFIVDEKILYINFWKISLTWYTYIFILYIHLFCIICMYTYIYFIHVHTHTHTHTYIYINVGRMEERRVWQKYTTDPSLKWIQGISVLSVFYFLIIDFKNFRCLYHWKNLNKNIRLKWPHRMNDGTKVTQVAFLCLYKFSVLLLFILSQLFNIGIST